MDNFDAVLENYGVERAEGIVIEEDAQHYAMQTPYYLIPTVNNAEPVTSFFSSGYFVLAPVSYTHLGFDTVMFTVSVDSIALMPCNPNIGGSSKGHLVREIDALGGEMGKNVDKTFIQSKMLNKSKGPAVHSLRAQADKQAYSNEMRKTLEYQENLTIRQGEVTKLLVEEGRITGVQLYSGAVSYTHLDVYKRQHEHKGRP